VEEQGGELVFPELRHPAALQAELRGLAGGAGQVAARDQDQARAAGAHQRRLLAEMEARAGEEHRAAFAAPPGRPPPPIHRAAVRTQQAMAVLLRRLPRTGAQLCRREPHRGCNCPRGMTSRAPPETLRFSPSRCDDASDERYRTALMTSSTSPRRRLGKVEATTGPMVRSAGSAMRVRIQPGETTLVRMRGASSTASDIASDCSAPFEAA